MTRRIVSIAAVLLAALIETVSPGLAQRSQEPATFDGRALFRTACASCHGASGQGNGPLAPALREVPADLTQVAARNGGVFPGERVRRIIDGRDIVAHGDPEMPVWGDAFKTSRDGYSEEAVRARIAAIVQYLESIQRRLAH